MTGRTATFTHVNGTISCFRNKCLQNWHFPMNIPFWIINQFVCFLRLVFDEVSTAIRKLRRTCSTDIILDREHFFQIL